MNKKTLYILIILFIFAGAGFYFNTHNRAIAPTQEPDGYKSGQSGSFESNQQMATSSNQNQEQTPNGQTTTKNNTSTLENTPGQFSSGEQQPEGTDIQVVQVNYDGTSFSPSTVNIKVGDYVIFKNNSSSSFWPASASHPTHTIYPEFDAKQSVAAGGKFHFQFNKVGTWGYHNHLNASQTGTVAVSEK